MRDIIDVVIEDNQWRAFDLEKISTKAFDAVRYILDLERKPFEVSILACNDMRIAKLNAKFRNKSTPTNILSWPTRNLHPDALNDWLATQPGPDEYNTHILLGDLALSYETCMREAKDMGLDPNDHIAHLIIHGILHLLGYRHETNTEATIMETLEKDMMHYLGLGNPYETL